MTHSRLITPKKAQALEVHCDTCQSTFRITPREGEFHAQLIDCMRCGSVIHIPEYHSDRGWQKRDRRDLFATLPTKNAVQKTPAPLPQAPPKSTPKRQPVVPEFAPLVPGSKRAKTPERQASALLPEEAQEELLRFVQEAKELAQPSPAKTEEPPKAAQKIAPPLALPEPREEEPGARGISPKSPSPLAPPPLAPTFSLRVEHTEFPAMEQQEVEALILSNLDEKTQIRSQDNEWVALAQHPTFSSLVEMLREEVSEPVVEERKEEATSQEPPPSHHEPEAVQGAPTPEVVEPQVEAQAPPLEPMPITSPQLVTPAPKPWFWRLVALGLAVGCVVLALLMYQEQQNASRSQGILAKAQDENVIVPKVQVQEEAVATASTILHLAIRQNFENAARKRDVALELVAQGKDDEAMLLLAWMWQGGIKDRDIAYAYATVAKRVKKYAVARRVTLHAMVQGAEDKKMVALWRQSIQEDPALHPKVMTLTLDDQVDRIRALGGGKSLSFKFEKDKKTLYAFKPSQYEWAIGWRAEVAAYLMCEALPCHFEVPKSLPARISREDFEELYGRFKSPKQKQYMERFSELTWKRETGPDGKTKEYLYGVLKEWVPDFVDWPIEYTDIWQSWLKPTASTWWTGRDLRDALGVLKDRQEGKYYIPIIRRRQGTTAKDLARGISSLLLFDYLTNNWDRFSNVEQYFGVNNQFRQGKFLSLDNGAAFHIQNMRVVEKRFALNQRFSKSLITGLKHLDKESFSTLLFPRAKEADARLRLRTFWRRRKQVLRRVKDLTKKHGEEKVLFFR